MTHSDDGFNVGVYWYLESGTLALVRAPLDSDSFFVRGDIDIAPGQSFSITQSLYTPIPDAGLYDLEIRFDDERVPSTPRVRVRVPACQVVDR